MKLDLDSDRAFAQQESKLAVISALNEIGNVAKFRRDLMTDDQNGPSNDPQDRQTYQKSSFSGPKTGE